MLVIADNPGVDAIVAKKDLGRPSVFRCDQLDLTKHAEGAHGRVLKIANRGGDDKQT